MRTFATLTVTGVASVVLFKLFAAVVFPLFGMALGLLFAAVKWGIIIAVIFFIYSMIKKRRDEEAEAA